MATTAERVHRFVDSTQGITLLTKSATFPGSDHVVVLDSSFNPPNRAHVKLIRDAVQRVPDSCVLILLATTNCDKGVTPVNDIIQRVEMMHAFWEDVDLDVPHAIGLIRHGKFVDKLDDIMTETQCSQVCFCTGFDTVVRLFDQKYYDKPVSEALDDFMKHAHLQALTRQPDNISSTPDTLPNSIDDQLEWVERGKRGELHIPSSWAVDRIHVVKSTDETVGVHSTAARQLTSREDWQSLDRIVGPGVMTYIRDRGLYR